MSSRPEEFHLRALLGRVEDWRAGLGRSLYSLLPRPFGCEVSQHLDRATFPVPATSIAACDRDRARTRHTVGEGFPIPLFRLRDGVTVSPWCTFPEAPLKCRTARFPGSGFKPWPIFRGPSQGLARFKRWFVCTPATPGLPTASPAEPQPAYVPVLSSRPPYGRERPPSVQSPFAQLGYYLRWGDVQRLLRGHYPSVVAHIGSCAAPVGLSPPSAISLVQRVFAGCNQSLLPTAASRRYLRKSFLGCWIPYPGGTPCALTCFFHGIIGLPQEIVGRRPRLSCDLRLLAA